jgi:phosphatidylethanolamine/phosphatidyl-N-methylethanolamine N-methyltransferase
MARGGIERARNRLQGSLGRLVDGTRTRPLWAPEPDCDLVSSAESGPTLSALWRKAGRSAPALFLREVFSNPRMMGAACPSSRQLALSMAGLLPRGFKGEVVELGAGTGVVTAALLKHGIKAQQLTVVERSPALVAYLRRRYPQLKVIEGDAAELATIVGASAGRVAAVISSLPLRSLPRSKVGSIMSEVDSVLSPAGVFIQFTYAFRSLPRVFPRRFRPVRSRIVWRNLPPARISMFRMELA